MVRARRAAAGDGHQAAHGEEDRHESAVAMRRHERHTQPVTVGRYHGRNTVTPPLWRRPLRSCSAALAGTYRPLLLRPRPSRKEQSDRLLRARAWVPRVRERPAVTPLARAPPERLNLDSFLCLEADAWWCARAVSACLLADLRSARRVSSLVVSSASLGCGKSSQLLAPGGVTASRLKQPRRSRDRSTPRAATPSRGRTRPLRWRCWRGHG